MLHDVDRSLRAWLAPELGPGTDIRFDPPSALAAAGATGLLGLFLHRVAEDLEGMPGSGVRVRDEEGHVVGTMRPARCYRLTYLVTAWTATAAAEHELLGLVLGAHAEQDTLAPQYFHGALRPLAEPLPLRIGWFDHDRPDPQLWSALGVPLRAAVELTVIAPVLPRRVLEVAVPVERMDLNAHDLPRRRWSRRDSGGFAPAEPSLTGATPDTTGARP